MPRKEEILSNVQVFLTVKNEEVAYVELGDVDRKQHYTP